LGAYIAQVVLELALGDLSVSMPFYFTVRNRKRHRRIREYGEMNISLPRLGAGFVPGGDGGVKGER
jgi:hypothetical protein